MSFATALSRLRLELGDKGAPFQAEVVGDNRTTRYDLPVVLVSPTGLFVQHGEGQSQTVLTSPTDYTMDYREGVLFLTNPIPADTPLVVRGTHYRAFLDEDLTLLLNTAMAHHNHQRNPQVYLDPGAGQVAVSALEEYAVVILAKIEALWAMLTDAAQEIDVFSPDGVSIPESQRYRQLLELLQWAERQYAELSQALNVGVHKIRVLTMRRRSLTTGRLVPVYVEREYDDTGPPVRVLPPIDTGLV